MVSLKRPLPRKKWMVLMVLILTLAKYFYKQDKEIQYRESRVDTPQETNKTLQAVRGDVRGDVRVDDKKVQNNHEGTKHATQKPLEGTNSNNTSLPPSCKMLHIGMSSQDAEGTRGVVAIIKQQLYFDPDSAFHIHLSASATTQATMETLLQTWELDRVHLTVYPSKGSLYDDIHVIAHSLPSTVNNIIFLGNNMRFIKPVSTLMNIFFKDANTKQFIGYVKSRRKNAKKDCVLCVHDILVLDMKKARTTKPECFATTGTQHILAKVTNAELLKLWDSWYVELDNAFPINDLIRSYDDVNAFRLGNMGEDYHYTSNVYMEAAREISMQALHVDGDSLGHRHHHCPAPGRKDAIRSAPKLNSSDTCKQYRIAANLLRRVHLYFIGSMVKSSGPHDVSLLTQLTIDRLSALESLLKRWEGPLHAVLYANAESDASQLVTAVQHSDIFNRRSNIAFHVVYRRRVQYPINLLRNVLLNVTNTPYLLMLDVDLIPSVGIYKALQSHIQKYLHTNSAKTHKTALVVPAFELLVYAAPPPRDRTEVLACIQKGTVVGYSMTRDWNYGHSPTDYPKWQNATNPYKVPYTHPFEPYVVMSRESTPLYNQLLHDRMKDKALWTLELFAQGYEFLVLHDVLITHVPHPRTQAAEPWRNSIDFPCAKIIMKEIGAELRKKYPSFKYSP